MLKLIQQRAGAIKRLWVMDRGIPTEALQEELRQRDPKVSYLVGRITRGTNRNQARRRAGAA